MEITVRKPTESEVEMMKQQPTWGCEVSVFDWHYDSEEHAYVLAGEVEVEHDGTSTKFQKGDYVIFPKGMQCVWKVTKAVKKHYLFK